jgi:hypothetical protein
MSGDTIVTALHSKGLLARFVNKAPRRVICLKKISPSMIAHGRYQFRVTSAVCVFCTDHAGSIASAKLPIDWGLIHNGGYDAQG